MEKYISFDSREAFRAWLAENHEGSGLWLLFGKKGGPKTMKAAEALEEALCFGWIDGLMKSLDDTCYIKYFAPRTAKSKWSDKNKKLVQQLIEKGMVTKPGMEAIENAKSNGMWEKGQGIKADDGMIAEFTVRLEGHEPAYGNYMGMPPSVRRTYAGYYFDAKAEETRQRRLEKIIDRLDKNLKPM